MQVKKGYFITFEGIDASGKSTQIKKITKYLQQLDIAYITTRDPGGTELGKLLREILLNYKGNINSTSELFLYLADRAQNIDEIILPALQENKIVLCDRHTDSTEAYQGYARGLNLSEIKMLNQIATHNLKPDLTFIFDIDVETSRNRLNNKFDRLEAESIEFHNKVRNGYLEIAKLNPERVKIIDANKNADEIFEETIYIIKKLIKLS